MLPCDRPYLLRQVRLIDPLTETDQIGDLLISEGKIQSFAAHLSDFLANIPVKDASSLIIAPALIDLYSQSGEPGYEERETIRSLIKAAEAGGFARVNILPTTDPKANNTATLSGLQQLIPPLSSLDLQFWATLTEKGKGEKMSELMELAQSEITGFTDAAPVQNLQLLRRLLEYLKPLDKAIALFPLNPQLRGKGVMREGEASISYGLTGDPAISETSALMAILELIALTETPVHLMRISTARSVELIAQAKERGLPVTASVTWLHLLGNSEDIWDYNPNWRLDPPLGNLSDQKALIDGVKEGIVDAIAVDHTPYTYEEKTVAFADAPSGGIGLELVLPLLWQTFVVSGTWSAVTLWKALSSNPAKCLNQAPISCEIGQTAQLILFDPQQNWTVGEVGDWLLRPVGTKKPIMSLTLTKGGRL
jgi:dihydroorotase